jgi:hypothetical protein
MTRCGQTLKCNLDLPVARAFINSPVRAHHWRFGDMPPVNVSTDSQIELIIQYGRALRESNGVF